MAPGAASHEYVGVSVSVVPEGAISVCAVAVLSKQLTKTIAAKSAHRIGLWIFALEIQSNFWYGLTLIFSTTPSPANTQDASNY